MIKLSISLFIFADNGIYNSSSSITYPENEQYEYYLLGTNAGHALLVEDHEIVVNPQTRRLTLVDWEWRHFLTDYPFTAQECAVLMVLLDAWPSYVPMDKLLTGLLACTDPAHDAIPKVGSLPHFPCSAIERNRDQRAQEADR